MLSTRLVPFVAPQAGQPAKQQTGLSALPRQPGHRQPLVACPWLGRCIPMLPVMQVGRVRPGAPPEHDVLHPVGGGLGQVRPTNNIGIHGGWVG